TFGRASSRGLAIPIMLSEACSTVLNAFPSLARAEPRLEPRLCLDGVTGRGACSSNLAPRPCERSCERPPDDDFGQLTAVLGWRVTVAHSVHAASCSCGALDQLLVAAARSD